jgi:hypothetical protein
VLLGHESIVITERYTAVEQWAHRTLKELGAI